MGMIKEQLIKNIPSNHGLVGMTPGNQSKEGYILMQIHSLQGLPLYSIGWVDKNIKLLVPLYNPPI